MNTLLVYGCGGLGKEIVDLAQLVNQQSKKWDEIHFLDDNVKSERLYNCLVLSMDKAMELRKTIDVECVIAVGEPVIRKNLFDKCKQAGFKIANLIAPSAYVSDSAAVGEGAIVQFGCFVSSGVKISANVLLQPKSCVGHDSAIGKDTVISTFVAIAGNCSIGERAYIGISVPVKEKISIGSDAIVGMGSVVLNDIPDGVIALGNPARAMKINESGRVFK